MVTLRVDPRTSTDHILRLMYHGTLALAFILGTIGGATVFTLFSSSIGGAGEATLQILIAVAGGFCAAALALLTVRPVFVVDRDSGAVGRGLDFTWMGRKLLLALDAPKATQIYVDEHIAGHPEVGPGLPARVVLPPAWVLPVDLNSGIERGEAQETRYDIIPAVRVGSLEGVDLIRSFVQAAVRKSWIVSVPKLDWFEAISAGLDQTENAVFNVRPLRNFPAPAQGQEHPGPNGGARPMGKGPDEKYCSECAAILKAKAVICPTCGCAQPGMGFPATGGTGEATPAIQPPSQDRSPILPASRTTAALFALLLGPIGAHKFYLQQASQGVFYLVWNVLGWGLIGFGGAPLGIPLVVLLWIVCLIEGLGYLAQSDETFGKGHFPHLYPKDPEPSSSSYAVALLLFLVCVLWYYGANATKPDPARVDTPASSPRRASTAEPEAASNIPASTSPPASTSGNPSTESIGTFSANGVQFEIPKGFALKRSTWAGGEETALFGTRSMILVTQSKASIDNEIGLIQSIRSRFKIDDPAATRCRLTCTSFGGRIFDSLAAGWGELSRRGTRNTYIEVYIVKHTAPATWVALVDKPELTTNTLSPEFTNLRSLLERSLIVTAVSGYFSAGSPGSSGGELWLLADLYKLQAEAVQEKP